ncbi:MFS transporter [Chitinimonas sp.]|uniref:MFS transporter n=1 Tax=Chitinimonas sp. TaxID=1934313 RepID=UPI0035AE6918
MSRLALPAYGLLGLPLAFVAMSIHVLAPSIYGSQLGVALGNVGLILFFTRLIDAAQDPLLGALVDYLRQTQRLSLALLLAALTLAAGFALLWSPPADVALAPWLCLTLLLIHASHSLINISYLSWGGRLGGGQRQLSHAAAWREGAGLIGVLLAAISIQQALPQSALNAALTTALLLGLWCLLRHAPPAHWSACSEPVRWSLAWQHAGLRRLLAAFALSCLGSALAATLAMFFIADRLALAHAAGWLLCSYFLAAAALLPLWTWLAQRLGCHRTWRLGMLLSALAFVGASQLGPGDMYPFLAICLASGAALGADLALPPVLLAQLLPANQPPARWYGLWALINKLALALASLALPALALAGYQPGSAGGAGALALAYAGLPCLLKLIAAALLGRQSAPSTLLATGVPS